MAAAVVEVAGSEVAAAAAVVAAEEGLAWKMPSGDVMVKVVEVVDY